jgi:YVTN family beta-propeller protein
MGDVAKCSDAWVCSGMRLSHRLLCTAAVSCLASVAVSGAKRPLLLAINKGDRTLAIVDANTYEILGKAPTGPDPHEVVASADGKVAYITNYTAGNGFANSLSVIDLDTFKALPPIDLGSLRRPHGITIAGGKIYFTAEGSRVVGRFDPASRKVDWSINTGQDGTHMVIVSNDLRRLFTTNMGSASVSLIDAAGRGQVSTIPVGRGAEGFDLSPDEKELWIANAEDSTVSIVDTAARKVVQTLRVPFERANRLKFTPDGKYALVSDLGGTGTLIVLEAAGRRELRRIELGGGAAGIQIAPDGSRAFVSVGPRNSVAVVDLKTLSVSTHIATGPGPDGLAWVK